MSSFDQWVLNSKSSFLGLTDDLVKVYGLILSIKDKFFDPSVPKEFSKKSVIALAFFGLTPLLISHLPKEGLGSGNETQFWLLGVYVSCMWLMTFFQTFKTNEIKPFFAWKTYFFSLFLSISILKVIYSTAGINTFEINTDSSFLMFSFFKTFFLVAVPEELTKLIITLFAIHFSSLAFKNLKSFLLIGMISGLGFGIYEGVMYQINVNPYSSSLRGYYILNFLRLTSLPFIHAVWSGISAIGFYNSIQNKLNSRTWLVISILIPSTLHALYNVSSDTLLAVVFGCVSTAILVVLQRISNGSLTDEDVQKNISGPATFGLRAGARIIDTGILTILIIMINSISFEVMDKIYRNSDLPLDDALRYLKYFKYSFSLLLPIIYFSWLHSFFGLTPGKKIMGIRLRSRTGKMSILQSFKREIIYTLSFLIPGIGFVSMIKDSKKRCLHDFITDSYSIIGKDELQNSDPEPSDKFPDKKGQLEEISALKEDGALTEEEYQVEKKKILSK
jgi:RsiW-degrading membrane proteinase PrsW (M82 family)/uncharacterized RDD family membrane protein YckC